MVARSRCRASVARSRCRALVARSRCRAPVARSRCRALVARSRCRALVARSVPSGLFFGTCLCIFNGCFYQSCNAYFVHDLNLCRCNFCILTGFADFPALLDAKISAFCRNVIFKDVERIFACVESRFACYCFVRLIFFSNFILVSSALHVCVHTFVIHALLHFSAASKTAAAYVLSPLSWPHR